MMFVRQPFTLGLCALSIILCGCVQQRIRDSAATQFGAGQYESAVQVLQDGVTKYPESPLLRGGLSTVKAEVVAKLSAEATQLRAAGQFDEAQKVLTRAIALEPKNERLLALKTDLVLERKLQASIKEAEALSFAGNKQQALRVVESALRDAPRQSVLIGLQRTLEIELRKAAGDSGRRMLAETRPITLDFRNANLSVVLDAITRSSGINFVLDRDVRLDSKVTVFLRNAKLDDAMDLVLGAQQLARRTIDGQTVLIYPNTPEKQREHQEQVIRVFHLSNSEAKATAAMLRSLLRIKEPFVDEKANFVAIRENPEIIALAERLVALQDLGDAEVMLEVEVLEVKTSRLTELGINFPSSVALTPTGPGGAGGLTVNNLRGLNSERVGVSVSGLLLNLRREVGDFNILANPRIRSKNREKAKILIGDKVPVITASTSATGFLSENVNYIDVGLKLEVEPVVSPDDEVTLKLGLEVSSLAREVRTTSGSLAYQIGTRNANTVLRLRDGETQILAGLISNEDRVSSNRVPGLGDLPVLGRLFSSQKDDYQRTELVLAITPRVLRSAPRPDISQAELWVGTELSTRLQARPTYLPFSTAATTTTVTSPGNAAAGTTTSVQSATPAPSGASVNLAPKPIASAPATIPTGLVRASWQSPAEVKLGEVFTVSLQIASSDELRGTPLEIMFPPATVEILEIKEGEFFKQDGGQTNFTHAINTATGRIGVGVLRTDSVGVQGQGQILQLQLRAKTTGPIEIALSSLKPIGLNAQVSASELPSLKIVAK